MTQQPLKRRNNGWLEPLERPALLWLAIRMPPWITPDRLTAIGGIGAIVSFVGYVWAAWNPLGLWIASVGFIINWFGDSLDGTVARHRGIERPKYGYFLDNSVDVAQQFLVTIGIGISGYLRWDVCLLALSVFLMMSAVTFLRTTVSGIYQLAHGGIGPTEMRVMGLVMNAVIFFVPPAPEWLGLPLSYPNVLSLLWSCSALAIFVFSLIKQIREVAAEDPPR